MAATIRSTTFQSTTSRRQVGTGTSAPSLPAIIFAADRSTTTATSAAASACLCESVPCISTGSSQTLSSTGRACAVKSSSSAWSSRYNFDRLQGNPSRDRRGNELSAWAFGGVGNSTPSSVVEQRLPMSGEQVYTQEDLRQQSLLPRRGSALVHDHPSIAIC
ncbi:unnamed protein product [Mortierella alpina]